MNQRSNTGFIYLSIVRGLLGQIAGTLIGMVLVLLVRLVLGLTVLSSGAATWWGVIPEPVWVGGAVLGVIGFILGTGVTRDWFSLAAGKTTPEHPTDAYSSGVARYLSVSYDHKVIGLQYGVTSLTIFAIAGLFALIFRTELAAPGLQFLKEETYNTIMSLHGIVMIAGILIGVGAMSNFLVPLLIRLCLLDQCTRSNPGAQQHTPGRFRYWMDRLSTAQCKSPSWHADVLFRCIRDWLIVDPGSDQHPRNYVTNESSRYASLPDADLRLVCICYRDHRSNRHAVDRPLISDGDV
jgi:hypothetical protein